MRKLLLLLAFVALAVGGWFLASPWLAMNGIVDAARDGDTAELEERIDFAALRDQARGDVRAEIEERTSGGDLLERLGGAVAGEVAGRVSDAALTPEGLANLVAAGSFAAPLVPARYREQELAWNVERGGLDSFTAVSAFEDGTPGPQLLFERDGLGWDLTGVRLAEF